MTPFLDVSRVPPHRFLVCEGTSCFAVPIFWKAEKLGGTAREAAAAAGEARAWLDAIAFKRVVG